MDYETKMVIMFVFAVLVVLIALYFVKRSPDDGMKED